MEFILTLLTSVGTLTVMWLAGNHDRRAWKLGLVVQCMWGIYIFQAKAWELTPLSIAIAFIYTRNIYAEGCDVSRMRSEPSTE